MQYNSSFIRTLILRYDYVCVQRNNRNACNNKATWKTRAFLFVGERRLRHEARVHEALPPCLCTTTVLHDFPSLTELEAALSEGTYLSPSAALPAAIIWRSVCHPPPPSNHAWDVHSGRSRASTAFFSPLCFVPSFGGPDNQAAVRVKGREKEEEKICGREKREEEKEEERPHRQCCQVYNKCTTYIQLSFTTTRGPDLAVQDDQEYNSHKICNFQERTP